ncbi:MAG: CDP-alcohol phosphatidyltransferase [Myxococcales bacterium]|nr:CDP-alcohol phosphatidyltransferase [Myxococcales bacterium]
MTGTPHKPFITANQVTLIRLALIPIPCWLLYQGTTGQYVALIVATLLGCTDFVDGYLARKYGGTVLGGLMDPIADKVFIAATFLPAVDLKWVPSWLVALLFVREFFVTAARTSYERRDTPLKSSYLSRYKTWAQMCGVGVLMLLSAATPTFMDWFFGVLAVLPVVGYLALRLIARRRWKGAGWFAISFSVLLLVHRSFGGHVLVVSLMYFVVGITWASGLGYLFSVGKLRGRGRVTAGEIVRLVTSIVLPCVAIGTQSRADSASWAIIALVAIELAHGGLDNLLAHHRAEDGAVRWGARVIAECLLLGLAWWIPSTTLSRTFCFAALFVATVGLVIAFVQKRRYYLDEKPRAVAASTNPAAVL